ncbi:putative brevis radix (BRX) domain-containing protein [Arabidopsis thaliana]
MNSQAEAYLNASEASESSLPRTSLGMGQRDPTPSTNTQDQNIEEKPSSNGGNMRSQEPSGTTEASSSSKGGGKELIEQFEPGVYVTYVLHKNGGKIFRRVRFSFFVANGDLMSIKQKNGGIAKKIGCLRGIVIMLHHRVQRLLIQFQHQLNLNHQLLIQFLHQLNLNHQLLLHNRILIKQKIQKKFLMKASHHVYNSSLAK